MTKVTCFSGMDSFCQLLINNGFKKFPPAHSARNGYEFRVPNKRLCFYDNRVWGIAEIEFTVMDYTRIPVYETFLWFFKRRIGTTPKYDVYTEFFKTTEEITQSVIDRLIEKGISV